MTSGSRFVFLDAFPSGTFDAALVVFIPGWIATRNELFHILDLRLNLPDYFGWNWDALEECLRDLSWIEVPHEIVLFHQGLPFPKGSDERSIYLAILKDAVATWGNDQRHTLTVVFPNGV